MSAFVHLASGTKPVKSMHVRDAGGTLRSVKSAFIRTKTGLKQFFGSFAVTLSTDEVVGFGYGKPNGVVGSFLVTAKATGNGPFTYHWARTDGGPHSITPGNPTSATTGFQATVPAGQTWTATFACTVTDASGQSVTTADVPVTLENDSL